MREHSDSPVFRFNIDITFLGLLILQENDIVLRSGKVKIRIFEERPGRSAER